MGPEILLRAFAQGELGGECLAVGDLSVLEFGKRKLNLTVELRRVKNPEAIGRGVLNVLDLGLLSEHEIKTGQISDASGRAAIKYVEAATALAMEGRVGAVVTLPINKEATRLSVPGFTGHTEFISEQCGVSDTAMMLVSDRLIVTHVSTHVSLEEAIRRVETARISRVIDLTHAALLKLRARQRIAVAGLNPHAGEHGAFGKEEEERIAPAVKAAQARGLTVLGPFAADTIFSQAVQGKYDAVVCMYHDQGHIPLKLLDFQGGVNVTLGLPIVRTSVDHGTAFDIAYQGVAFTRSLVEAYELAGRLCRE